MVLTLNKSQISELLPTLDLLPAIEKGFVDYSRGNCIVPPVGELLLPNGEVHIKYGCIKHEPFYVIKIASGFYGNVKNGLSSSNGLMHLFSQDTGQLVATLLDEGTLTDQRTAAAGAICAKYLAPDHVDRIGIIGTGTQAALQAEYLKRTLGCRRLLIYGRCPISATRYKTKMEHQGFIVELADSVQQLCLDSRIIITTTPSTQPLIQADWVAPGTHITAVGSDTPEKQELDAELLGLADLIVADSLTQCLQRGEISKAINAKCISVKDIVELGNVIESGQGRKDNHQITIADLTGVAVQDINIAESIYRAALSA